VVTYRENLPLLGEDRDLGGLESAVPGVGDPKVRTRVREKKFEGEGPRCRISQESITIHRSEEKNVSYFIELFFLKRGGDRRSGNLFTP